MNSILGVLMEILKWSCAIAFGTRAVNMLNNKVLAEWNFFFKCINENLEVVMCHCFLVQEQWIC